jgi:hypothetical protein
MTLDVGEQQLRTLWALPPRKGPSLPTGTIGLPPQNVWMQKWKQKCSQCGDCEDWYILTADAVQYDKHLLTLRRKLLPLSFILKIEEPDTSELYTEYGGSSVLRNVGKYLPDVRRRSSENLCNNVELNSEFLVLQPIPSVYSDWNNQVSKLQCEWKVFFNTKCIFSQVYCSHNTDITV